MIVSGMYFTVPSEVTQEGARKEAGAGAMESHADGILSQKQIWGPIRERYLPSGSG